MNTTQNKSSFLGFVSIAIQIAFVLIVCVLVCLSFDAIISKNAAHTSWDNSEAELSRLKTLNSEIDDAIFKIETDNLMIRSLAIAYEEDFIPDFGSRFVGISISPNLACKSIWLPKGEHELAVSFRWKDSEKADKNQLWRFPLKQESGYSFFSEARAMSLEMKLNKTSGHRSIFDFSSARLGGWAITSNNPKFKKQVERISFFNLFQKEFGGIYTGVCSPNEVTYEQVVEYQNKGTKPLKGILFENEGYAATWNHKNAKTKPTAASFTARIISQGPPTIGSHTVLKLHQQGISCEGLLGEYLGSGVYECKIDLAPEPNE